MRRSPAVALLAAACASAPAVRPPRRAVPAWTNRDLRPIQQPRAVGAVAVGIAVTPERGLLAVGIDPATGRELWRRPITPSRVTPGVRVQLRPLGGDRFAYYRPTAVDTWHAQLVVAEAATGRDVAASPETLFTSPPEPCRDGGDVCATAWDWRTGRESFYRLEVASGRFLTVADGLPRGTRTLTDGGLVDLGDRPGNSLGRLREGRLDWVTPVSAAFPPGFSSDFGWSWHLFARERLFVGSVFKSSIDGENVTHDLARGSATAALDETTGAVVWRDDGSSFSCRFGPEDAPAPVRCRSRGVYTLDHGVPSYAGLDVTLEGFDVKTGKTTWSLPVGASSAALGGTGGRPPVAGPSQVVLGGRVVDFTTGAAAAPRRDATFWCLAPKRYQLALAFQMGADRWVTERRGGELASVCDAGGRPATVLPDAAATAASGARVGRFAVLATEEGYVGYEVPGEER